MYTCIRRARGQEGMELEGKDHAAIVVIVLKLLCLVRRQHTTSWCIGFRQTTLPTAY